MKTYNLLFKLALLMALGMLSCTKQPLVGVS